MAITRRTFLTGTVAAGVAGATVAFPRPASAARADEIRSHPDAVTVAVIGDYGSGRSVQRDVSRMVHGWKPDAVLTAGDNVYSSDGGDPLALLQEKVGDYYGRFVAEKRFFPALGNHDWGDPGTELLWSDGNGGTTGPWHDFFDLPGNGRYYDVRIGPLHAFILNDSFHEPDGHRMGSQQARWFERVARDSTAPYKVVVHHYAPYVSNENANKGMRWPFPDWGIDASFTGHWHHYERREVDGVQYIVNGLGGAGIRVPAERDPGVDKLYSQSHGACRLTVAPDAALIEFLSTDNVVQDSFIQELAAPGVPQPVPNPQPIPPQPPMPQPLPAPTVPEPFLSATGREATVARLYLAVFERVPDPAGYRYWIGLDAHMTNIASYFASSLEFRLKYGALDNADFTDRIYRNVLGRAPDSAGFAYWLGLLNSGTSRGDIVLGFSESKEFRLRTGIGA